MASFLLPVAAVTLVLFVLSPVSSVAAPILDTDGDLVKNGGSYYIIPRLIGVGGLALTKGNSSSPCPLFITQKLYSNGLPVLMSSPLKIGFLMTSMPIEFYFNREYATCNKELRWWVAEEDENNNSYVVVGADGKFKDTYAFKIEEAKTVVPDSPYPVTFVKADPKLASYV
ncbi:kunitz-type trypsin inhibitor alpha chain-like [Chenopodium quinoa]|uniref:kunitz-type trypsin inhibitor alpha chain-like n=1 Tax=Chenopodium quinoa TaxID=63459 RepID=UPI000B794AE3|nr:kunitz-type trypsin inhibitor alpha chain-like [Chenopodium quinoa]